MAFEENSDSSGWFFADGQGQAGPFTLTQLRRQLPSFNEPASVLVWRNGFSGWAKAGDVPELRDLVSRPPLPPSDQMPTWRVKWWWYPVPFLSIAIGSQVGRKAMIWNSMQRRQAKEARRIAANRS
ncbi:DUF4339 domain-containing protein [Bradyrhizobium sp. RT6a]|uniref:DUF4339 domain-containing protein n=1 Tax=unclassified Bradyrhizobium TaxID=2631580 RepID=UPI00339A64F2